MDTGIALLITVVLLAANALFVAAEFALLTARRHRLEQLAENGRRGAAAALAGVRELSLMLAAAQLGITMASLGLGIIGEPAIAHALEPALDAAGLPSGLSYGIAFAIALSVVVFLHMVVGEMMPKSWAITHPEAAALRLAGPFRGFALVFRPVLRLMNALANGMVRLCGVTPIESLAVAHTPSDLALLVQESTEHGTLPPDQGDLLGRALSLHRLDARAVRTTRSTVVSVSPDCSAGEIERIARESGRSRLPVIGRDNDVHGVVHVKDLLLLTPEARPGVTAGALARPAVLAAETEAADGLLVRMRRDRQRLVLVVDEYGDISGLVTLEDLVEELIGDIEDETDPAAPPAPADGTFPAGIRLDELRRQTGLHLAADQADTLAGWVLEHLQRLGEPGDAVHADGVTATVMRTDGARIVSISLRPDRDDEVDSSAASPDPGPGESIRGCRGA